MSEQSSPEPDAWMVECKRYVVGFVYSADGRVLLLRKNRPDWQAGKLNGVGGKVEPGESFADAMLREGQEETAYSWRWEHFATLQCNDERHSGEIAFFRTVSDISFEGMEGCSNDVGEGFEVHWLADVIDSPDTIPNLRWLVPMGAAENDRHDWPYLVSEKSGDRRHEGRSQGGATYVERAEQAVGIFEAKVREAVGITAADGSRGFETCAAIVAEFRRFIEGGYRETASMVTPSRTEETR